MKMTKRIVAMAACAVMTATFMVGMSASAATDDHGNTMATATTFTSSVSGKIETTGDVDFFKYTATSSGVKFFTTTGNNSIITVYNASGSTVSSSGGTYGGKKLAGYNMNSGETCYVSVRENRSTYGTSYTLKVSNKLNVSHLYQGDSRWGSQIMKGNTALNETIAGSGCAITSCAVVINYLKNKSITPATLNTSTYLDSSNRANWSKIGSAYNLSYTAPSTTEVITYLKRGYPVIVHKGTHFSVAVGYENGNFLVSNVGASSSSIQTWSKSTVDKCIVFYSN